VAGTDATTVTRFLTALQRAVARKDRRAVAALADYPLRAWAGSRSVTLQSPRELLRRYDRIFDADLRRSIAAARPASLWANYRGVMFDSGRVWFAPDPSGRLRLIAINRPISPPRRARKRP
jgi:hypothetical protein